MRRRTDEDSDALKNISRDQSLPFSDDVAIGNAPKLDRTLTDTYNDELYNPGFTITRSNTAQDPISPNNSPFTQRLQAANSHLGDVRCSLMGDVCWERLEG